MFPAATNVYATAKRTSIAAGIAEILLSVFLVRGYYNALRKISQVLKEFNYENPLGFSWGYAVLGILVVVALFEIIIGLRIKPQNVESGDIYFKFIIILVSLGLLLTLASMLSFYILVIVPITGLPDVISSY